VIAAGAGLERDHDHAGGRDQNGGGGERRDPVAQKDQAEECDLHRLGLDIGVGDDERALAHGGKHERGGGDLRSGAGDHPWPEYGRDMRQAFAGRQHDADQQDQREGKTE
jgi:hypothetical protein